MLSQWTTENVFIAVRTYPMPSKRDIEVSCTAAVTADGRWIRLFPVPYRRLKTHQKFVKYQWIKIDVKKATDSRPESFNIAPESIEILAPSLPADRFWRSRKEIIAPLQSHCMCCIQRQRREHGAPTLGFFKPYQVKRLLIEPDSNPKWTLKELAKLSQMNMFDEAPAQELEKIPFAFKYDYRCDHATCSGHQMSCTDWEAGELYRKVRAQHGDDWESYFRQKYEHEMIDVRDTHFYVGTMNQHPDSWIIVGLFYPFPDLQQPLFP
jgi:hypothetical protein